jgi:hypothetical protein
VTCGLAGTVCSDDDGECHCGDVDGPQCGEGQICDQEAATCLAEVCAEVVCLLEGTICGDDGECHCGDPGGPVCGEYESCDAGESACTPFLPDAICTDGTRWTPGTAVFREATEAWGLTGAKGTRLNLADINGDGWVDILVRNGATGSDVFTGEGARYTYLMLNDGAGHFSDVTQSSGLLTMRADDSGDLGRPNTVAAFADVDNDGDIDAFTGLTNDPAASAGESSEIMLNDGDGNFTFVDEMLDMELRWVVRPGGASFVDYDRDGNVDLWVTQDSGNLGAIQDRLFRGDGSGRYSDDTVDSGLLTRTWSDVEEINEGLCHTNGWGAAACDLNGDGTPELLSPSYGRAPNHLWLGAMESDGRVTFENRSVDSGYAYDDDFTWQDNEFARCYCRDNPDAEGCEGVDAPRVSCSDNWNHPTDREPFRLGGNSGSTFCADVDNDGDLDLLTSEIKHWWAGSGADGSELLVNQGDDDVWFERPGDATTGLEADHLGRVDWDEGHMTNAVFDFDNDGWLDVYIGASDYPGNRGMLYHQEAPLSFVELAVDDFFEHNRSHGVVFADIDHDGDLDVIVGHSRARCSATQPNDCYETTQVRAFENIMEPGNWIQLHLVGGEGTNRAAIGARAVVEAGDVTQTQEVGGGFGHFGAQNDMVLHFGLGSACEAEVTVRWPDADLTEETFTLPAGYRFLIVQGEAPRVAP